jgi:hypothetical protein
MTGATHHIDDLADPQLAPELVELSAQIGRRDPLRRLRPEALLESAIEATGLHDFGDDWFRTPLDVLCRSLRDEAGLSPLGVLSQRAQLVHLLSSRLLVEDLYRRHPEIEDVPVERPIIIAGLPRSGTTYLHNLLAADPALRRLTERESEHPADPVDETEPVAEDAPVDPFAALLESSLPHLKRMIDVTAESAHEEIRLLALSLSSVVFQTQAVVPSYRDWYLTADQRPAYGYLRRVLKAVQWQGGGGRWVLKAMQHIEQLPALISAFPDATVVVTHRDPVRVVTSLSTMLAYTQRLTTDPVDPVRVGRFWTRAIHDMTDRILRDHDDLPAGQVVDLRLDELRDHRDDVVRRIYDTAGQPFTTGARDAMRAFESERHPHRHGRVGYDARSLGLDAPAIRSRTSRYRERFAVPVED